MTCEVAVANRLGIALAADSAATFTQSGTGAQTYATGANKIFQLTEFDPVGCMIFNNSALAGIPWELLIKAYRSQKTAVEPSIAKYCDDFKDYVEGTRSSGLLPESVKVLSSAVALRTSFVQVLEALREGVQAMRGALPLDFSTLVPVVLQKIRESNDAEQIPSPLSESDFERLRSDHLAELSESARIALQGPELLHFKDHVIPGDLAELAIHTLLHRPYQVLRHLYTGIVFAGFGSEQFLPSCMSLKVYGFVAGKLLTEHGEGFTMDHTGRDCFIQPFATRSMVETFMLGASSNVYGYVHRRFHEAARGICTTAIKEAGQPVDISRIEEHIKAATDGFMHGWINDVSKVHLLPLLRIVGGLSLEELAELADTLVMLESLKEKVTYRTQSVGGPVDVALITKSDGLVWIKRKLYFDATLNHRYLARVSRKHRSE